jgi:hypothetical protein
MIDAEEVARLMAAPAPDKLHHTYESLVASIVSEMRADVEAAVDDLRTSAEPKLWPALVRKIVARTTAYAWSHPSVCTSAENVDEHGQDDHQ